MRKVILFNMMTLDGLFEGPDRNIDWHRVDEEFNDFAIAQLNEADVLIFGRVTYELMAGYWPTPSAIADDPQVAGKMNSLLKLVFSKTLEKADWENTRLIREDAGEEISRVKQQPGKDLLIFGSAVLASTLANQGLIDELRVIINPVILGSGSPLFQNLLSPIKLALVKSRTFGNGNVLLVYQTINGSQ